MKQQAQRLRKAADFQRVRARRQSWAHPLLVLYAAPNEGGPTRSGFVVGRRVGNAVVRNRVKRRLREAVRARYSRLPEAIDLVWIARPASAAADFATLAGAVEQLLRRARLLRAEGPAPARLGDERRDRQTAAGGRLSPGSVDRAALTP